MREGLGLDYMHQHKIRQIKDPDMPPTPPSCPPGLQAWGKDQGLLLMQEAISVHFWGMAAAPGIQLCPGLGASLQQGWNVGI